MAPSAKTKKSKDNALLARTPRAFAQARARRTYQALLDAALAAFTEQGYDTTQTPDIAGRAGVSVGTFYRYFQDKRQVFLEIMQSHMQRGYEEVMGRLTPERFVGTARRATIEQTLQVLLAQVTRNPRLERVFLEMSMRDPEVAALYSVGERAAAQQLAALIRSICTLDQVPDPDATAYVVQAAVVECAKHIAGYRGAPPLPRERAIAALTQLVYRALFGADPADT